MDMSTRIAWIAIVLLGWSACWVYAGGMIHRHCGCAKKRVCPKCHCEVTIEEEKVKKHCYEVEHEQVCIPKVRIPWHRFTLHKCHCKGKCTCGKRCHQPCLDLPCCFKVRTIRVLKKEEYECKVCKCKFTPVCVDCGCDAGCGTYGAAEMSEAVAEMWAGK